MEGHSGPVEALVHTHGLVTRPGTLIRASSEGRGWRSVFVSTQREAPFDTYYCQPVADDLIVMPLSGPVRVTRLLGGKRDSRLVVPGGAFIMPGGADFSVRLEAPLETVHFYLHRAVVDELAGEFARNVDGTRIVPRFSFLDPFLEQIAVALREQLDDADTASALYIDHLARAAAGRLLRNHSTAALKTPPAERGRGLAPPQLRRAIDYIEANLEDDLTLLELAAVSGLSPVYFARQFKRATGLAPYQYLMRARVARAKRLLSMGDLPIAAVALDCGFCHQEHLTRVFRRHCATTPGAYRAVTRG